LQLLLAALLGGIVGVERELKGKPAGLRTNVLICVGATLFTVLSLQVAEARGDPGRVAAQIIPGVGFIGAGTILHMRGAVTGLTSAATIWVVSAIGVALGLRAYVEALGTTALVMVVLAGLGRIEGLIARHMTTSRLVVHLPPEAQAQDDLESVLRTAGVEIERSRAHRENVDLVVELDIRGPKRLHEQALLSVVHHPGVRSGSTGEGAENGPSPHPSRGARETARLDGERGSREPPPPHDGRTERVPDDPEFGVELKAAIEALRRRTQQYRLLAEQAADAVLLVTPGGRLLNVNLAACNILLYT